MIGFNDKMKRCKNSFLYEKCRIRFSEKNSGSGNPMYGKKLTEEHKKTLTTSRNINVSDGTTTWESVTSYIKEKKIGFQKYKKQLEEGTIFLV
jgi:hypothetical protein